MGSHPDQLSIFRARRIGLLGFDQVTASHLVASGEAFQAVALNHGYGGHISCYDVSVIGVPDRRFRTECGRAFKGSSDIRSAPPLDTIIVAGGRGILNPVVVTSLSEWLGERASITRRLCAIGTGIYALASAGLLNHREVAAEASVADDLRRRFPLLKVNGTSRVVQSGPYCTSAGLSAAILLALHLVEEDFGRHIARSVGERWLRPLTNHGANSALRRKTRERYSTARFADILAWMLRNLNSDLSVKALARRACMDPGHFSKMFKSVFGVPPTEFVANLRLNEARRRVLKRPKAARDIASAVGFTSGEAVRRTYQTRLATISHDFAQAAQRTNHCVQPLAWMTNADRDRAPS